MKTCRENLKKLKDLCQELGDRDQQLKINASTLWFLLENINNARSILSNVNIDDEHAQIEINRAKDILMEISKEVSERGCKKVSND